LTAREPPCRNGWVHVVGGALVAQRELERQSYSCAPQCLPIMKLGDDAEYFKNVAAQVKDHNADANGLR
jgi:hypothetical protein